MVTLTTTRARTATVLLDAAECLTRAGWDPIGSSVLHAIDRVAGYTGPACPAEDVTTAAWDAIVTHLDGQEVHDWEQAPGRTQQQVIDALRAAASRLGVAR